MQPRPNWPPQWPDIVDSLVIDAIRRVPRHLFVAPEHRSQAYEDIPLPIGAGQTISQPHVVAMMTQALRLTPTSRILEVGTGSGYQAAVLAAITPHVWSIEARPELAERAQALLDRLGYTVQIRVGNGALGWPEEAPFDGIIVTAAGSDVPPALVAQLAPGARLVIPVAENDWDQVLWAIERTPDGQVVRHELGKVLFVPLVGDEEDQEAAHSSGLKEIKRQLQELFGRWR